MIIKRNSVARSRRVTASILAAGILTGCAGFLPLSAAHAAKAPTVVAESSRTVTGGRSLEVTVGQAEIASRITSVSGATGGMVGGLLGAAIDSSRAKGHEATITQVRDSLLDFDTDGLAISTTREALTGLDWLAASELRFSKDASYFGKTELLDTGDASQAAFFDYYYELMPDFSAVRVVLTVQFINKAVPEGKKPDARFKPANLAYAQTFTTTVALPAPGADITANAALWSADNGKRAREALTLAFADTGKVMARALVLNEADYKTMTAAGSFKIDPESEHSGQATLSAAGFTVTDTLPQNP